MPLLKSRLEEVNAMAALGELPAPARRAATIVILLDGVTNPLSFTVHSEQ